jgi:hypothetical protein
MLPQVHIITARLRGTFFILNRQIYSKIQIIVNEFTERNLGKDSNEPRTTLRMALDVCLPEITIPSIDRYYSTLVTAVVLMKLVAWNWMKPTILTG